MDMLFKIGFLRLSFWNSTNFTAIKKSNQQETSGQSLMSVVFLLVLHAVCVGGRNTRAIPIIPSNAVADGAHML